MGVNQFADLTVEEFRVASGQKRGAGKRGKMAASRVGDADEQILALGGSLPAAVDWRNVTGMVLPVKDQGQCGSCWAFATTFAVESAHALLTKGADLVSLSEQQVVSCDKTEDGCNGGDQLPALQWLATTSGQCTEKEYPYTSGGGADGTCKKTCTPRVTVTGGVEVAAKNETALMAALATLPISLSVDASSNGWQLYAGGVYTSACKCNKLACLDHAVGGVGFGTDTKTGEDFWIVRNSWSASWGEDGYIRIARGAKYGPEGQCGILQDNQWAEVSN